MSLELTVCTLSALIRRNLTIQLGFRESLKICAMAPKKAIFFPRAKARGWELWAPKTDADRPRSSIRATRLQKLELSYHQKSPRSVHYPKKSRFIDEWVTMHGSNCTRLMIGSQSTTVIVRDWWFGYNARQWLHVIDDWVTKHDSNCTWLMIGLQSR